MRSISLKWKALGVLSLVLAAIIAALSWLSYTKLLDQFKASQAVEEAVYVREIRALLHQVDARLQQLASWLPALEGMGDALLQDRPQALEKLFERHWPSAQLDYDLQSVSFYSLQGKLMGRWDDGSLPPSVPAEWVEQVTREEQPLFALICAERCHHVGVLPLLVDDRTAGTLVLTVSVVELIVRFREVSGRDIGILIDAQRAGRFPDETAARNLGPWGLEVVALSDAQKRMPLLQHAALDKPSLPGSNTALQLSSDDRDYAVKLFPMQDFTPYGAGYFAVVSDVTEAVERIRQGLWRSMLAGIGGALFTQLVLFLLLSTPLTRLQRTARILPLLAQGGFEKVRAGVEGSRRSWGFRDEIDHLDETAIDLASQLEILNGKVLERTEALKLKMRDLDRERSFVSSLLDTAKVIILTLDAEGRIGLANRYAMEVTGYDLIDLVGRPFQELLNPVDARSGTPELGRLQRREIYHFAQEAELVCATGRRLQIAWFHSTLDTIQEGGAVVLSAGLDITERKHAERRIAWLADHDPLTGLVNRRRFESVLQRALRVGMERREASGALMYIDLDQFKLINDTLGHSAGDRVLESFAGNLARLGDSIAPGRETLAARLGGDEFAVVVEWVDREGAMAAAQRLREGLNRMEYNTGTEVFKITSSIGVALFPEHGMGFQELMQNADLAMYKAKSLGEGRVELFSGDEAMRTRMANRLRWKERIDEALDTERLFLHFQPILELGSGRVSHYEALVRMQSEEGTTVPPSDFIPVAESTGQITAIDCRVLDLAFDAWKRLSRGGRGIGIHINLSARAFQTPEWLKRLNGLLDESGADPADFVFEITETAAVTNLKDARDLMNSVRAKGCHFALDDFGVGFSSFNYVKELPVDLVKIDGAFITRLAERRDNQIIVKALVDAARGFGKSTVAEFVDSAETLEMLRRLEVDYAQGFYVGRPVPEKELAELGLEFREATV